MWKLWQRIVVRRHGPKLWSALCEISPLHAQAAYHAAVWSGAWTKRGFVGAAFEYLKSQGVLREKMCIAVPTELTQRGSHEEEPESKVEREGRR